MAEAKFISGLPALVEEWSKVLAANSEDWVSITIDHCVTWSVDLTGVWVCGCGGVLRKRDIKCWNESRK